MAGDIVDNDCDGWIDEEENNGIGNVTTRNVTNIARNPTYHYGQLNFSKIVLALDIEPLLQLQEQCQQWLRKSLF